MTRELNFLLMMTSFCSDAAIFYDGMAVKRKHPSRACHGLCVMTNDVHSIEDTAVFSMDHEYDFEVI